MSILQDISGLTGSDETECFILLCMQNCGTLFSLEEQDAAGEHGCLAYAAPIEMEGDSNGKADR
ncbi:MAG: hypothetical protein K6F95_07610 [Selenomonas sp.]|uniref:hypothetical protein n=1 Tax=Selenomonas sp. TaxID=2053611 RepID=UPI0025E3E106|nr:hypothetical protein [Selenomonas sp.]MCR5757758.1 hypothetical protein [Selenomonas sp.]